MRKPHMKACALYRKWKLFVVREVVGPSPVGRHATYRGAYLRVTCGKSCPKSLKQLSWCRGLAAHAQSVLQWVFRAPMLSLCKAFKRALKCLKDSYPFLRVCLKGSYHLFDVFLRESYPFSKGCLRDSFPFIAMSIACSLYGLKGKTSIASSEYDSLSLVTF